MTGGEGGIRTHGGVTPTPVFETGLFNRSSTSPSRPLTIPKETGGLRAWSVNLRLQ